MQGTGANEPGRRKEITRKAVLNAALDVFGRRGFEAATMGEIGHRLGISDAALYHHFPSKRQLLEALLGESWYPPIPDQPSPPPVDSCMSLIQFVDEVLGVLARNEELVRLVSRESMRSELARDVRATRWARWAAFMESRFTRELPAEARRQLAQSLSYYIAGVLMMAQVSHAGGLREALTDRAFLEGVHRSAMLAMPIERYLPRPRRPA